MTHSIIDATTFLQKPYSSNERLIIDVRSPAEFKALHLPSSKNIPLDKLNEQSCKQIQTDAQGKTLYLLCGSGTRAKMAKDKFLNHTDSAIVIIEGGINELQRSNAPLNQAASSSISLERQVRIAAGVLVVIGVTLSLVINPAFIALSAFVGLGLIFAGITDSCGMALVLSKMPWNQ